jgi:hypothetical protein
LTVHFWDGAYVLIIFLLGSGIWLLDVDSAGAASADVADRRQNGASRRKRAGGVPR